MKLVFIVLFVFFIASSSEAQVRNRATDAQRLIPTGRFLPDVQQKEVAGIFSSVERGCAGSTVSPFAAHLANSIHLTLPGNDRGQFSSNQASQLLTSFFADRRSANMRFENIASAVPAPYAFGTMVVEQRSRPDTLRVYVALTRIDNRWQISQFAVY